MNSTTNEEVKPYALEYGFFVLTCLISAVIAFLASWVNAWIKWGWMGLLGNGLLMFTIGALGSKYYGARNAEAVDNREKEG